jgi:hypothetical protein
MSTKKKRGGWTRPPSYGNLRHGAYGTRAYYSWTNMKTRCLNPNSTKFKDYGGRGIGVCERWMDFPNFLADMGQPPVGTSLERKDVNGHYEPGNCVWADDKTQANNKQSAVVLHGERMSKREASRRLGKCPNAISSHMTRTGMTFDETVAYMKGV